MKEQHILVVEDEAVVAFVLNDFLSSEGYRVTVADSAIDALRAFADADKVDAMVTDLKLAGCIDGIELIHRVRAMYPALPVVVLSGTAPRADMNAIWMQKPMRMEDVLLTLQKMLAN